MGSTSLYKGNNETFHYNDLLGGSHYALFISVDWYKCKPLYISNKQSSIWMSYDGFELFTELHRLTCGEVQ